MKSVDPEIHRFLTLLRDKIRERGFTQLQVQETLGWGRSYISQLLTKQKCLRVEQVLLILTVIGTEPAEFFAEIYPLRRDSQFVYTSSPASEPLNPEAVGKQQRAWRELGALFRGLVGLLLEKQIVTREELSAAAVRDVDL